MKFLSIESRDYNEAGAESIPTPQPVTPQITKEAQPLYYKEADEVAKYWFTFSMIWFPIFATLGLILAIKFFYPTFLVDWAPLTFGRIRPAHVNGVLLGFVSSGLIGAMYYAIPRLTNSGLYKPMLAKINAFLWNAVIVIGILLVLSGNTQAREYAEFPWIIDVLVMIALIINGIVVLGSIAKRKEPKLYGSLWFWAGIMIWFPIVYFIGNVMWNPPSGALTGLVDAVVNWFYGHNVLGLWFTPFGIGLWYYYIPRLIKKPLYSVVLSYISFFSLAFFYTGVGGHHILQSPIPEWLKTIAVITSVLMLFSVMSFGVNVGMTMRGAWHTIMRSVPLRFMVFGFICYILVSLQGSFQALRDMNLYLHFSQWPVGHAHLALLGGFGFAAVGVMYYVVPRIKRRPIYSSRLMGVTWWIAFGGFIIFFLGMSLAGLVQNSAWFTHMTIAQALPFLTPYFVVRAIGGGMVVVAGYLFATNIILTLLGRGGGKGPIMESGGTKVE